MNPLISRYKLNGKVFVNKQTKEEVRLWLFTATDQKSEKSREKIIVESLSSEYEYKYMDDLQKNYYMINPTFTCVGVYDKSKPIEHSIRLFLSQYGDNNTIMMEINPLSYQILCPDEISPNYKNRLDKGIKIRRYNITNSKNINGSIGNEFTEDHVVFIYYIYVFRRSIVFQISNAISAFISTFKDPETGENTLKNIFSIIYKYPPKKYEHLNYLLSNIDPLDLAVLSNNTLPIYDFSKFKKSICDETYIYPENNPLKLLLKEFPTNGYIVPEDVPTLFGAFKDYINMRILTHPNGIKHDLSDYMLEDMFLYVGQNIRNYNDFDKVIAVYINIDTCICLCLNKMKEVEETQLSTIIDKAISDGSVTLEELAMII